MKTEPVFMSNVFVSLESSTSDMDGSVVRSARVSTVGEASSASSGGDAGLIGYLMRNRHGTPFEHASMTFRVRAPIFVVREFMRHRVGWSYNEESARYRKLEPAFYVPGPERPLEQVGKAGHYTFESGTPEQHEYVVNATEAACRSAYAAYEGMLAAGVAREVARGVLPVCTFSSFYATCNPRSLMHFLSLRTVGNDSLFPSFPQAEIAMVADLMEQRFAELAPLTHAAFVAARRVCP